MYATVSRRSREIGLLQALGFFRLVVLASSMMEAVVLAVGGAALGAVASLLMSNPASHRWRSS